MKSFKYILKRVIIGVLLFLAISFIKDNVFAISYDRYGNKNYSQFQLLPTSATWYDSEYIYNMFQEVNSVYGTNYDITDYDYITVSNYGTNNYLYNFSNSKFEVDNSYIKINATPTTDTLSIDIRLSNSNASNRYYTFTHIYNYSTGLSSSASCINCYNTNTIAGTNNNEYSFTIDKIVDINSVLSKPYIEVSYLDENYNIITSNSCSYVEASTCDLQINSNLGTYIQVSYNLDEKFGNPIDFLSSHTYKLNSYIYNSNNDIRLYTVNPWFYWGDSTNNIDSELYFPTNKKIYYSNDKYRYEYSFTFNNDYTSYYVYEFIITYKTNGSNLSTIKIPMNFDIADITEGSVPVLPPDDDTEIDKDDIIINQNQQIIDGQQEIKDTLTNDNIDGSSNDASNFFSGFTTDTHGLTGVITSPLNLINSLTSKSCTPLSLPLPFVNQNLTIPCMSTIYRQYFSDFLTIYQLITFGFISYWVVVRIFNLVKDFKNPDHDEIEVVDL